MEMDCEFNNITVEILGYGIDTEKIKNNKLFQECFDVEKHSKFQASREDFNDSFDKFIGDFKKSALALVFKYGSDKNHALYSPSYEKLPTIHEATKIILQAGGKVFLVRSCNKNGLLKSAGSDFHRPEDFLGYWNLGQKKIEIEFLVDWVDRVRMF